MAGILPTAFIWSVADLLRDNYKKSEYAKIILPFTVLRRLDCVLQAANSSAVKFNGFHMDYGLNPKSLLLDKGKEFTTQNIKSTFIELTKNSNELLVLRKLRAYIQSFNHEVQDIFEKFNFDSQIEHLQKINLLYLIIEKFSLIDLHPDTVSNHMMGMIFEELIRKFSELSNEISGEHFTPREVIRLMVSLLFIKDNEVTTREGIIRKLYDPTAGTGGMLSAAEEHLRSINPSIQIMMCGQEINSEAYAICKADMLIKGQDIKNISLGNTLSNDQHCTQKYDYMLSNPPFGVEWRNAQEAVKAEHFSKGFTGRFGPGLPRISDGSLLFLMHLISKMQPRCNGGSRIAIVLNGSPMFIGGAGSGESQIRRHIFENDLVEAIIQLPEELFYNTSISTYIWIITNKKSPDRTGKVQLIDASCFSTKLSKSLGKKRKTLEDFHISKISEIFKSFKETSQDGKSICKILNNEDFGYRSITIDRPININGGKPIVTKQYKPKADRDLREIEILPLSEEIEKHLEQEVLPNHPDAWIEKSKTKIGYQVLFNRFFYKVKSHKSLKELDKEIKDLACSIAEITEDILQ